MTATFERRFKTGVKAESEIARYLANLGWKVIPIRNPHETPVVLTKGRTITAPDLLAITQLGQYVFVECKQKDVFSWHRKQSRWETGVSLNLWREYCEFAHSVATPLWVMFLHTSATPWEGDRAYCPNECPSGLFRADFRTLFSNARECPQHNMVYWGVESLKKVAELNEVVS